MTIGLLRSVTETLGNYVSMEFGAESWRKVFGVHDLTPEEAVDQRVDLSWLLTTFAESMGIDADGFACGFGKYFFRCLDDPAFDENQLFGSLGSTFPMFLEKLNELFIDPFPDTSTSMLSVEIVTHEIASNKMELELLSSGCQYNLAAWAQGVIDAAAHRLYEEQYVPLEFVLHEPTHCGELKMKARITVSLDDTKSTLFSDHLRSLAEKKALEAPQAYSMPFAHYVNVSPFHLVVDRNCQVVQAGVALVRILPDLANQGSFAGDSLRVVTPACVTWEFDELIRCTGNSTIILGTGDGLFIKGGFFKTTLTPADGGPPQDVAIFQGTPLVLNVASLQDHSLYISDLNASDMLIELILASQELDESHHRLISLELEADLAMAEIRRARVTKTTPLSGDIPNQAHTRDIHKAIKVLDRMIASSGSVSRQEMIEAKQALSGAENRLSNGRSSLSQCLALTSNMYDAPSTGLHSSALYEMQNQSISRVVGGLAGRVVEDDVKSSLLNLLSGVDCKDLESSSRVEALQELANIDECSEEEAPPTNNRREIGVRVTANNRSGWETKDNDNPSAPISGTPNVSRQELHSSSVEDSESTQVSGGAGPFSQRQRSLREGPTNTDDPNMVADDSRSPLQKSGSAKSSIRRKSALVVSKWTKKVMSMFPGKSSELEPNVGPLNPRRKSCTDSSNDRREVDGGGGEVGVHDSICRHGSLPAMGDGGQTDALAQVSEPGQDPAPPSPFENQAATASDGNSVPRSKSSLEVIPPSSRENSLKPGELRESYDGKKVVRAYSRLGGKAGEMRKQGRSDRYSSPMNTPAATTSSHQLGLRSSKSPSSFIRGPQSTRTSLLGAPYQPIDRDSMMSRKSERRSAMQEDFVPQLMTMYKQPEDELLQIMGHVDDWQFDSFALDKATDGHPLSFLAYSLFKRMELTSRFGINEQKLIRFLIRVESGYPQNPYHNRVHAADVLRSLHVIAARGGVTNMMNQNTDMDSQELMNAAPGSAHGPGVQGSPLLYSGCASAPRVGDPAAPGMHPPNSSDGSNPPLHNKTQGMLFAPVEDLVALLATYMAAIVHDYDHRGVNNQFLIKSGDPLALLYNDISPMENHHVAATLALLRQPEYDFMGRASQNVRTILRSQVIDMVLSTDMKQHFSTVSSFTNKLQEASFVCEERDNSMLDLADSGFREHHNPDKVMMDLSDSENCTLVWKMSLKCADLGHWASPWKVHRQWVQVLEEEMFRQGDKEKQAMYPVSPLMDRNKPGITVSQEGFFNVVVQPLYHSTATAFPSLMPMLEAVAENCRLWSSAAEMKEREAKDEKEAKEEREAKEKRKE